MAASSPSLSLNMSLSLPTAFPSVFSATPFLPSSNSLSLTKWKSPSKPKFLHTLCSLSQAVQEREDDHEYINRSKTTRRSILFTLGSLASLSAAQVLTSIGAPVTGSTRPLEEFGSEPRLLDSTIRVLVPKPRRSNQKRETAVLVVDGVGIKTDGPVRFDVYVAKWDGDGDGGGSADLGFAAGSLIELSRVRVGRNPPKGALELGITRLLEAIEAEDSEKLVVSLVPRTGEVIIGGVHIEYRVNTDDD